MLCRSAYWNYLPLPAAVLCCWLVCSAALAEEAAGKQAKPSPAAPSQAAPSPAESGKKPKEVYDEKLAQWKEVLKELRALAKEYNEAEPDKTADVRRRWDAAIQRGNGIIPALRNAARDLYLQAPNEDPALARFLVKLLADEVARDEYEQAGELSQVLLDKGCDLNELHEPAGIAAFALNDFEKAKQQVKEGETAGQLTETGKKILPDVESYKLFWKEEQELRLAEAKKDDLPRVRLTTSKGDIVVELFENEAPGTVGNFISLVERAFYDDLTFHRVLPGFMAQGGCPVGDGSGDPGYKIYCELDKDNYRKHFRGSLSMAHAGRDTGGSQFFLTFLPTPFLNGKHTVLGRVIEGLDVLAKIQRRDPSSTEPLPEPDRIIKAVVVRKRDHEYAPKKVN